MTEFLFALGILALAALGLGAGLLLGRPPLTATCAGASRPPHLRCADCPLARKAEAAR